MTTPSLVPILLVDDKPQNLLALRAILGPSEYEFALATSGNQALQQILETPFACVLLDVEMPVMNGLEVARTLREDPVYRALPIIFLTAHRLEDNDMFQGYRLGAADYLLKPVQSEILRSKVRVFADLFRKQQLILSLNTVLESRNRELQEISKMAAHDLKEPARLISTYCQLLERSLPKANAEMEHNLAFLKTNSQKICSMLDRLVNYLEVVHSGSSLIEDIDMDGLLEEISVRFDERLSHTGSEIVFHDLPNIPGVRAHIELFLNSLLDNALTFAEHGPTRYEISSSLENGETIFYLRHPGVDMSEAYYSLFTASENLRPTQTGSSFSLSLGRQIIHKHGGCIAIEKGPENQDRLKFSFGNPAGVLAMKQSRAAC